MLIRPLTLALFLLGSTIVPGLAAPRTVTVDNGTFGSVEVLAPAEEPTAFIAVVANTSSLEAAAKLLKIDSSTLYRKRKAYDQNLD